MAKKLKTLVAERSLDEVELNRRNCTIRQYEEKLSEMKEMYQFATHEKANSVFKHGDIQITTIVDQKCMECAPYSDGDSNISLLCELQSNETLDTS